MGVYVSRTWSKKHGLVIGGIVAAVHLLFLLYLHFAYHTTYEGMFLEVFLSLPLDVIFLEVFLSLFHWM